ncbi:MAG: cupredoxin domain-containing protein [Acidobacteriota bacterium]
MVSKSCLIWALATVFWPGPVGLQAETKVVKIGNPAPEGVPTQDIQVSAKKYEFNPATIEVNARTLIRIHLRAEDREHGFALSSDKDSCAKFKPEEPVIVEFYADQPGEFEFKCCKFCGFGHKKMKGKLVVKPAS